MCGLAGIFGPLPERGARMKRALDAMQHRGPDGRGVWSDADVMIGHVRLALVDPEGGQQPLAREHLHAVVTGELYDHDALRTELESRGHRFASACDSELVLHAYREWGERMFEHLHGEYALAIHDAASNRVLLARDPMGVRPLLWCRLGDALLIASEAKGLWAMGLERGWDDRSLAQALRLQYPLPGTSIFRGIHSLRPGERLTFHPRRPLQLARTTDGALPYAAERGEQDGENAGDRTLAALQRAVARRLRGGSACTLLSGGLDSATVTALAAAARKAQGRPVLPAYTVSFEGAGPYDEWAKAREIAGFVAVPHRAITVGGPDMARAFANAVVHGEGLAINGHIAAKRILARTLAADGHNVVLTGEGADELFLGYAHLRADLGAEGLGSSNVASSGLMLPERARPDLATWIAAKVDLGTRVCALLHGAPALSLDEALASLHEAIPCPHHATAVECNAHRWTQTALAHYILQTLGDRTEMAFAVEARFPMLDRDVAALSRRLPVAAKVRNGQEKWCIRQAMAGCLPASVLQREKHPFLAPPSLLFDDDQLSPVAQRLLDHPPRLCDRAAVERELDGLRTAPQRERIAASPALTLLASIGVLEEAYQL